MGIEHEQLATDSFSKEELMALKHLASRVMNKNPAMAQPKVEKPAPPEPPKVNRTKLAQDKTPRVATTVEVSGSTVPEKVKPPRKRKEIEVTLPNGQVVKTAADQQQDGVKKRSLQEIADAAASRAMAQVQSASQDSAITQMLTTVK
jgi:hypothetical protein